MRFGNGKGQGEISLPLIKLPDRDDHVGADLEGGSVRMGLQIERGLIEILPRDDDFNDCVLWRLVRGTAGWAADPMRGRYVVDSIGKCAGVLVPGCLALSGLHLGY